MRLVNFTHGELYSFGAYMMYLFAMQFGANFFVSLVLAVVLGAALGALIELVLLRKLRRVVRRHSRPRGKCSIGTERPAAANPRGMQGYAVGRWPDAPRAS